MRKISMLAIASILVMGASSMSYARNHNGMGMHHNGHSGMGMQQGMNGQQGMMGGCQGMAKGGMMNGQKGGLFASLDLTAEQQKKMDELMTQLNSHRMNRGANQPMMADMQDLVMNDTFDEAAVRKQIEENVKQQIEHRVEMAKIHNQMFQVLTPEQKAKAKSFHEMRAKQQQERAAWQAKNAPAPKQ